MSTEKNDIPVYQGEPLNDEQKRLNALFDEMKKGQLTFLDEAGKRIIELSTGLLGVLFAVTAFGKDFPPPYLKDNLTARWLGIGVLVALIIALLAGVLTVQPRNYDYFEHNLTEMRKQLQKIVDHKSLWMKFATWAFFAGALLLAILIGTLIWSA
jgi:hypothetical protein